MARFKSSADHPNQSKSAHRMLRRVAGCAVAFIAAAFTTSSVWALSSCPVMPTLISQCCVADQAGQFYELGADLTPTNSCIEISAPRVFFEMNGHTIISTSAVPKGIGVHVLSTAANAAFGGGKPIENFATGFKSDAPNTVASAVFAEFNNQGIVFNGPGALGFLIGAETNLKNGIILTAAASGSFMANLEAFTNSKNGIVLNGTTGVTLEEALAAQNSKNGIVLNRTTGAALFIVASVGNGGYGLWLKSSSFNSVDGGVLEENTIAGAYLGCHAGGPSSAACSVPPSNGNTLAGFLNSLEVGSDCHSPPLPQEYGIAIDKGNRKNHVIFVTTDTNTSCSTPGDTVDDGYDGNGAGCAGNFWSSNKFPLVNHTAIPAHPFCID
jgi:Periplasmic copper-binding protein (NosD)